MKHQELQLTSDCGKKITRLIKKEYDSKQVMQLFIDMKEELDYLVENSKNSNHEEHNESTVNCNCCLDVKCSFKDCIRAILRKPSA